MKKYHISSFSGRSGISEYSRNFFDLVMSPRGYKQLDSDLCDLSVIEGIKIDDLVHIEIGVNEASAIRALYQLIDRGHRNVSITLHDPPFISWPYFRFPSIYLNNISKFIHLYLRNFGVGHAYFKKIKTIFVLTRAGVNKTVSRYRITNVQYLPFLVSPATLRLPSFPPPPNLIFFGYIAKNKGLKYALELHERLLDNLPQCKFFVVGDAVNDNASSYLCELKNRFKTNVEYLGFVDDSKLREVFALASVAVMPFAAYKSIVPASASILRAMASGKVVCATPANAIPEFIQDGVTGILLCGDVDVDAARIRSLITTEGCVKKYANTAFEFLSLGHGPVPVGLAFDQLPSNRS